MKKHWQIGDQVELISDSYKDDGHKPGDTGKVVNVTTAKFKYHTETDIRVEWDNGAETCWISAEDFCHR